MAAAILVLGPVGGASAQRVDCAKIFDHMWRTGESPAIAINPDGTVRVTTSRGYCEEPIDVWSRRKPPQQAAEPRAPAKPEPQPQPKPEPKASAPVPPATEPRPAPQAEPEPAPSLTVKPEPPMARPIPPPSGSGCDLGVEQLWDSRVVEVEGVLHWLARAFTLDVDGVPGVEDVGFILKAGNGAERQLRYFGTPDETAARELEGLGLQDDGLVRRLCFGDVRFRMPPFFGEAPGQKLIGIDKLDLAAEAKARQEGRTIVQAPKKGGRVGMVTKTGPGAWAWVAAGAGAVVVLGAGLFLWRRRVKQKEAAEKAKEEEEDEDDLGAPPRRKARPDDDEKEGEGAETVKKGPITAFFGRLTGDADKEGEAEGDDAGEAEEGADKAKKRKKDGLFGLFRGKGAKKAKGEERGEAARK